MSLVKNPVREREEMSVLSSLAVIVVATYITTWYNDKISRAEYLKDE